MKLFALISIAILISFNSFAMTKLAPQKNIFDLPYELQALIGGFSNIKDIALYGLTNKNAWEIEQANMLEGYILANKENIIRLYFKNPKHIQNLKWYNNNFNIKRPLLRVSAKNIDNDNIDKLLLLCSNVSHLDLSFNNIGDAEATAIANSEALRNLQSLNLQGNNIGAAGATAIANSQTLTSLQSLNLNYNNISANVKELVRQRFPFVKI